MTSFTNRNQLKTRVITVTAGGVRGRRRVVLVAGQRAQLQRVGARRAARQRVARAARPARTARERRVRTYLIYI